MRNHYYMVRLFHLLGIICKLLPVQNVEAERFFKAHLVMGCLQGIQVDKCVESVGIRECLLFLIQKKIISNF